AATRSAGSTRTTRSAGPEAASTGTTGAAGAGRAVAAWSIGHYRTTWIIRIAGETRHEGEPLTASREERSLLSGRVETGAQAAVDEESFVGVSRAFRRRSADVGRTQRGVERGVLLALRSIVQIEILKSRAVLSRRTLRLCAASRARGRSRLRDRCRLRERPQRQRPIRASRLLLDRELAVR